MRKSAQGFTLVELMVVMVMIAILAVIALISTVQSRYDREMDRYASAIIHAMKEARSRAINTGRNHVVHFYPDSVQWCDLVCPPATPPTCGAVPMATCLPAGETHQYGKRYVTRAGGAGASHYVTLADFNLAAMPAQEPLSFWEIKFKPDGSMDGDPDPASPAPDGFTVYLQHQTKSSLKYRIVILPLSGEIRKFNTWAD